MTKAKSFKTPSKSHGRPNEKPIICNRRQMQILLAGKLPKLIIKGKTKSSPIVYWTRFYRKKPGIT